MIGSCLALHHFGETQKVNTLPAAVAEVVAVDESKLDLTWKW